MPGIFIPDMVKPSYFLLVVIGALLVAGCSTNKAPSLKAGSRALAHPVYYCKGVQYYSIEGRYCYFQDHKTHYINHLPSGGHYYYYGSETQPAGNQKAH
jgi:outer membrane biogenesis lipoprotein LolB